MLDKKILEGLFRQNYGGMIRLARTILDDDGEAEDVVQDVFVRLANRDNVSDINAGYLMTAVHHGCMNQIRRKQLHNQVHNLYPIEPEADIMPTRQLMERLDEIQSFAREQMHEPYCTIFRLRFDEDLTIKEIAERTRFGIGTVHKYLQQSIRLVQQHLKQQEL